MESPVGFLEKMKKLGYSVDEVIALLQRYEGKGEE